MMSKFSRLFLFLNIGLWYGFTVLSTIFSKKYLNHSQDPNTLTLMCLAYAAFLKLIFTHQTIIISLNETLPRLLRNPDYLSLGLFNVATIFFTNIGICQTSIALTYMVKVIYISIFKV